MAGDKSWAGKLALSYIISNNKLYIYTSADGNLGAICYAVKYLF